MNRNVSFSSVHSHRSHGQPAIDNNDDLSCSCETIALTPGTAGSAHQNGHHNGLPTLDRPIIFARKHSIACRPSTRNPHRKRVLQKNGSSHLIRINVPLRYARYLRDLGNTMVNSRWRWITVSFVISFFILWFLFGWFWMIIGSAHGDLDPDNPRNDTCSVGIDGFAGFLLMSIETQTTIGYGSRAPTENCLEGVFMLCLQMILGIGVQGAILGLVFLKMTRPAIRDSQRLFSRHAVICQRNGDMCLMFRVCDKRRAHIVSTKISAYLMEIKITEQGEMVQNFQTPLELEPFGLLLWPLCIVHKIGPNSPLYDVSAKDLLTKRFELVVIMIGCSDSTGQMTQSRTSYLPIEIRWGHRFKPCVSYDSETHAYVILKEFFNATDIVDTPLCSAKRLYEVINNMDHLTMPNNSPADSPVSSPITSPRAITFGNHMSFEDLQESYV